VPSWSLSIEEHFYLLIPLLLFGVRKLRPAGRCFLLLGFVFLALLFRILAYRFCDFDSAAPGTDFLRLIYYPFHTRMDALAMGVLVAAVYQANPNCGTRSLRGIAGVLGILLTGYLYFGGGVGGRWGAATLRFTVLAVGFGAVLWSVLPGQPATMLARFLSLYFWVPIARLSYALYLTHLVVLQFVDNAIQHSPLAPVIMLAGCVAVALPLFLFIEEPLHRYARRVFR
jgi:peptidoglycan/LPS O-acetylase OafA/YrhL